MTQMQNDIFFIWTHGEKELYIFLKSLNEFDPCILTNGKIFIDVYVKPTDHHQYLNSLFVHLYHAKMSVAFSQTLRISGLCSSEKDFENHKEEIKSWFRKREYSEALISSEMRKVISFRER